VQTLATNLDIINPGAATSDVFFDGNLDTTNHPDILKAVYRQLFKENWDLEFFHNDAVDSAYLNGKLTTQQLVLKLLTSEMYRDYIFCVNSNYRFVDLCFERVLGRPATEEEKRVWSSLLATAGLNYFAERLFYSDESSKALGKYNVPPRRSLKLSSSHQGLPALPASASIKRYDGPGRKSQFFSTHYSFPSSTARRNSCVLLFATLIIIFAIVSIFQMASLL